MQRAAQSPDRQVREQAAREAAQAMQQAGNSLSEARERQVAAWKDDEDLWDALDRADRVLYDAKRGRTAPHGSGAVPEQRAEQAPSDAVAGEAPDARTPEHEHRTADESA